jgi:uncharacterized protein
MQQAKPLPSAAKPLSDIERDRLEALLDALPAPLEPLDLCALDGYLAAVLLQPTPVPAARWLAHVHDLDGRPAPAGVSLAALHALVKRRHAELAQAIEVRRWFDPWLFELAPALPDEPPSPSEMVLPWVAGFAAAMDLFPAALSRVADAGAQEVLALLYRHFDPDDLEDADALLALIDTLEPPESVDEAVEDLVRGTLLLADVTRPQRRRAKQ